MKPIVTIVSGTINRLPLLKRMIASARLEARGLPIDFIIVDNGSTDGTEDWCKTQADVTFMQMGKPVGGIQAFTIGGMASVSRYTILANDDIEFMPYSILSAYRALEDNPQLGGVAFADNRIDPNFATQKHSARTEGGAGVRTVYAQVGMYDTRLMQACGVWGGSDEKFGGLGAWTYGGDNYLTSRLWESGYLIGETPLAKIRDYVHEDDTRKVGILKSANDARLYHARFDEGGLGRGAVWRSKPLDLPERNTSLRILYLPAVEVGINSLQLEQMTGLRDAFSQCADVVQFAYSVYARDFNDLMMGLELHNLCKVFRPDILFMQVHSCEIINADLIAKLKKIHNMLVVNFNGDYWRQKLFAKPMLNMLAHCDLQLVVDNAVVDHYTELGIKSAYWQVGYESPKAVHRLSDEAGRHDVVFVGNVYSQARVQLVQHLYKMGKLYNLDIGFYGRMYPKNIPVRASTDYDYATTQELYRRAKMCIGTMEFADSDGYVSNRLFECLHAGGLLLQQRVINAQDRLGLIDGVHYLGWDTLEELTERVQWVIQHPEEAQAIARQGKEFVDEYHNWGVRIGEFWDILERL